ncbi:MAG: glycosyltransferase family 39 protein [Candidatus Moraniibacteriota bacterium]
MKKKKKKRRKGGLSLLPKIDFLKSKYFWIFLGIFALGVFLRSYNFVPWIHLELDQARDATLIDESLSGGAMNLPLLGPRAAGSFLRLGPISYYIDYLFSLPLNNAVIGSALATLFFSVLSMIAFYFFLRRYFSKTLSLAVGSIFATSLFVITYSRFAWNPNLLPFFIILFFLALLRAVDEENEKNPGMWLMLSAVMFGVLSQLHFLAMIVIFIAAVTFLVIKRPRIKLVFWISSVLIVLFLNLPLVINDLKSGGDNIKQLTLTVEEKSEGKASYDLAEKIIKNYTENTLGFWTIVTGSQDAQLPRIALELKTSKIEIDCTATCKKNFSQGVMALVFFTLGIIILMVESILEKEPIKRDFLWLNLVLFLVSFGIFTPLAYDLSPRFFLIIIPLPFIFWGLIFYELKRLIKINNLIWAGAIIFAAFNIYFTVEFFGQLAKAKSEQIEIGSDKILRQKTRVTLEQQQAIVDYIEKVYKQNNYAVLYHSQSELHRAFAYLLDKRQIPRDGISMGDTHTTCRKGNYFLIIRSQSDRAGFAEYFTRFTILEEKNFGTLTLYHLSPKAEIINCEIPNQAKFRTYKDEGGAVAKRYTWKEIFNLK